MKSLEQLSDLYLSLPFNHFLGLSVTNLSAKKATLNLPLKPEFIGNTSKSILHGGVTASAMDASGGLLALANLFDQIKHLPDEDIVNALYRSCTIDLRVDYLKPGSGKSFLIDAKLLRSGKRIITCQMQLSNQDKLIASATATYALGSY